MDIITTATCRSNLFLKTFDSFERRLFGSFLSHRLVVNIDPIGPDGSIHPLMSVIEGMFGRNVRLRVAQRPNYMAAFMWAWMNGETEYLFELEDDWLLLREFDLNKMITIMDANPDLAYLRLSSWATQEHQAKQWNKGFPWNGEFFECPVNLRTRVGFCGHPGIMRRSFIQSLLPHLDMRGGPEKQINGSRKPEIHSILARWRYGVFAEPDSPAGVKDMGRKWRTQQGYAKDSATRFQHWVTLKNS